MGHLHIPRPFSSISSRVTLATFTSSTALDHQTQTGPNGKQEYNKETFDLDSYDSLVKVFQRTRKREGFVDRVVLWAPGGIQGKSRPYFFSELSV